jgi:hypothetical protein
MAQVRLTGVRIGWLDNWGESLWWPGDIDGCLHEADHVRCTSVLVEI